MNVHMLTQIRSPVNHEEDTGVIQRAGWCDVYLWFEVVKVRVQSRCVLMLIDECLSNSLARMGF